MTVYYMRKTIQTALSRAVDGDALACGKRRIRLVNVYAVEIIEPGGLDVKQRLTALVRGQNIALQPVASNMHDYHVPRQFSHVCT